jgi:tRNA-uridine 2-sulfurtransferase
VDDLKLLVVGRQFRLDEDIWFVIGRDEQENSRLEALRKPDDWLVRMTRRPGPLGLLRHGPEPCLPVHRDDTVLRLLAGIVIRYGKKVDGAFPRPR